MMLHNTYDSYLHLYSFIFCDNYMMLHNDLFMSITEVILSKQTSSVKHWLRDEVINVLIFFICLKSSSNTRGISFKIWNQSQQDQLGIKLDKLKFGKYKLKNKILKQNKRNFHQNLESILRGSIGNQAG